MRYLFTLFPFFRQRNQSTKVLGLLYCMLVGILLGCDYDGTECFPNLRINFMSTSDVDSVQFYLNGEQVCFTRPVFDPLCENCADAKGGVVVGHILCEFSRDEGYVYLSRDEESTKRCARSDGSAIWVTYECHINENNYGKPLDSLTLTLRILSKENTDVRVMPLLQSGNHYNIIADKDTAQWYSYTKESMSDYFSYYGPPSTWQRIGCFDVFCIAKLPMSNKDVCYDK